MCTFFFFKQKTAYEMRISDWSSDVCSSDLPVCGIQGAFYNRKTSEEFGAEIVAFKGTAEALTALKQNRCVAFVYDDAFIVSRLAEAEWTDWQMPLPTLDDATRVVAGTKGAPAFDDPSHGTGVNRSDGQPVG